VVNNVAQINDEIHILRHLLVVIKVSLARNIMSHVVWMYWLRLKIKCQESALTFENDGS
jgi:hypothetical protein